MFFTVFSEGLLKLILLGKEGLKALGQMPVDSNVGIVPNDSALTRGVVKTGALIAEFRTVGKDDESVCKALGDIKLMAVLT